METVTLPPELATLVAGATWEQVSRGESGAQVYRSTQSAASGSTSPAFVSPLSV